MTWKLPSVPSAGRRTRLVPIAPKTLPTVFHAYVDPTWLPIRGERLTFEAPLPDDLAELLSALERRELGS